MIRLHVIKCGTWIISQIFVLKYIRVEVNIHDRQTFSNVRYLLNAFSNFWHSNKLSQLSHSMHKWNSLQKYKSAVTYEKVFLYILKCHYQVENENRLTIKNTNSF